MGKPVLKEMDTIYIFKPITGELRLITPPLARELASQTKNLGGISFWRELVSEIWKTPGELAIFHLKNFRAPSAREKFGPFLVDFPL